MVCGGFVYAVGFDGFNVQTATGGEVEAWLAAAGGGSSGGSGGGGSDDMPDDDGEGDPSEDREEGEVGTDPCDCYSNIRQDMRTHADCKCGNKTWKKPRKSGKYKNGGWFNPCGGLKDYPCGKGKKGGSTCKGRNKHQDSGLGHCPCPSHPIKTGTSKRDVWEVCNNSSKTSCGDGCWQGKKG